LLPVGAVRSVIMFVLAAPLIGLGVGVVGPTRALAG
jgi:hypothetical protein